MTKALFAALSKAFPEIEGAVKDSNNPHFKTKYADLGSVVEAIKPALVKHGLFFAQVNHEQQGGVCVETLVCHDSGEQMSFGKLFVPASKQDAQGYGSALTYARRYSLMTAFGVCPEDDDGNAAAKAPGDTRPTTGVRISDEQLTQLQDEADATGADLARFCKYMGVMSLKDIPAGRFQEAFEALASKRKKAA